MFDTDAVKYFFYLHNQLLSGLQRYHLVDTISQATWAVSVLEAPVLESTTR